jgi:hypothetical protein
MKSPNLEGLSCLAQTGQPQRMVVDIERLEAERYEP